MISPIAISMAFRVAGDSNDLTVTIPTYGLAALASVIIPAFGAALDRVILVEIIIIGLGLLDLSVAFFIYFDWDHRGWRGKTALAIDATLLLLLVPRYLHLLSVAIRRAQSTLPWAGRPVDEDEEGLYRNPLPSQQRAVRDLLKATGTGERQIDRHFNAVALKARWGAGKTAALRMFQRQVEQPDKKPGADAPNPTGVVIWYDCWRHQADSQFEFSLYWEAAQHWDMVWPYGWLVIPAWRLYATVLPIIVKASMKVGSASVELDDKGFKELAKATFWQKHLESLVRVRLIDRQRVALVLEDIDRCNAQAAQKYVTLIRRFLAVPGLSAIVPFVEEQFRPKVFEPFASQIPDLAATTDAVLWSWAGQAVFRQVDEKWGKDKENILAPFAQPGADGASPNVIAGLRPHLLRAYASGQAGQRERILSLLEDKYLADSTVRLDMMSPEDCAYLLVQRARARDEWVALLANPGPVDWPKIEARVAAYLTKALPPAGDRDATPRQFQYAASLLFQELTQARLEDMARKATAAGKPDRALLIGLMGHLSFEMARQRAAIGKAA